MDDSGFEGKSADSSGLRAELDKLVTGFSERVNANNNDHGLRWENLFPDLRFGLPHEACEPLEFDFSHLVAGWQPMAFDICNNWWIQMARDVEKWLLYVATCFYIWRRLMTSEVPDVGGDR